MARCRSPMAVLCEAYLTALFALPAYSHKNSPKKLTQHQLFACLVLKDFCNLSYRATAAMLVDCSDLREAIRLERVPHCSTLEKAAKRLLASASFAADAGFDSEAAHELARDELGIQSLINPTIGHPTSKEPKGRYRRQMKRHLHNSRYSQRWQVETVFSMIKRCSGEVVDAQAHHPRRRLLHLKDLTHNLAILQQRRVFD